MATIEQVEKLREKANVSYDEAKAALEASGDDILDAIIYLERAGKVPPPKNEGYYNSKSVAIEEPKSKSYDESNAYHGETFSQLLRKFLRWCGKMISKGNSNMFEVKRHGQVVVSVPVTVLVLLLIFAFWIVVPLLIVGLFLGCRYFFRGPDLDKTCVNNMMDKAASAAESIKKDVKDGHNE